MAGGDSRSGLQASQTALVDPQSLQATESNLVWSQPLTLLPKDPDRVGAEEKATSDL